MEIHDDEDGPRGSHGLMFFFFWVLAMMNNGALAVELFIFDRILFR